MTTTNKIVVSIEMFGERQLNNSLNNYKILKEITYIHEQISKKEHTREIEISRLKIS